jgi:cysteinylglycine-S-conjugate dipeptidase
VPACLLRGSLARLLSTLHDAEGNLAVQGLSGTSHFVSGVAIDETWLRKTVGVVAGIRLTGDGPIEHRLWNMPAVTTLAIDAPRVSEAMNQLQSWARAKVSFRLPPEVDAQCAAAAIVDHLRARTPWGAKLDLKLGTVARGARLTPGSAMVRALTESWDVAPKLVGSGASIPAVAELSAVFPAASIAVRGVVDAACAAHAPNESVDLKTFERLASAEALFMRLLAVTASASRDPPPPDQDSPSSVRGLGGARAAQAVIDSPEGG